MSLGIGGIFSQDSHKFFAILLFLKIPITTINQIVLNLGVPQQALQAYHAFYQKIQLPILLMT